MGKVDKAELPPKQMQLTEGQLDSLLLLVGLRRCFHALNHAVRFSQMMSARPDAVFSDDHDHGQRQDEPARAVGVRGGDAAPEPAALYDGPHGLLPLLLVEYRRRDAALLPPASAVVRPAPHQRRARGQTDGVRHAARLDQQDVYRRGRDVVKEDTRGSIAGGQTRRAEGCAQNIHEGTFESGAHPRGDSPSTHFRSQHHLNSSLTIRFDTMHLWNPFRSRTHATTPSELPDSAAVQAIAKGFRSPALPASNSQPLPQARTCRLGRQQSVHAPIAVLSPRHFSISTSTCQDSSAAPKER